jgi:hypothetical protein
MRNGDPGGHIGHDPPAPEARATHGRGGCGFYCPALFPAWYGEVIAAFEFLKGRGLSEEQAVDLCYNGGAFAGQLAGTQFGPLGDVVGHIIGTDCLLCAKDTAYK